MYWMNAGGSPACDGKKYGEKRGSSDRGGLHWAEETVRLFN